MTMKHVYVIASIITILLLITGFALFYFYAQEVLKPNLYEKIEAVNSKITVLQILKDSNVPDFCSYYSVVSEELSEDTWSLGNKLELLEQRGIDDSAFKRLYFDLELRDLVLSQYYEHTCNVSVNNVIFFYSNKGANRAISQAQGEHLLKFWNFCLSRKRSLRIFSFDSDYNTPTVNYLKHKYNINNSVAVIIGNVSYDFLTFERLKAMGMC